MRRSLFADFYFLSVVAPTSIIFEQSTVLAHPQSWPLGGASGLAGRMVSCVSRCLGLVMMQCQTSQSLFGQMLWL